MMSETVDVISDEMKSSCRIRAKRVFPNGTETGDATSSGFLWRHGQGIYVITNWHCVSGKNPETLEALGSFYPSHIEVCGRYIIKDESGQGPVSIEQFYQSIRLAGDDGEPLWIEHSNGHKFDVVAVRLPLPEDRLKHFFCLNEIPYLKRWQPNVASDAFMVGYPEGLLGPKETPIWKRASVATEPALDYEDKPVFLVDCIGNKGLSGAPVVSFSSGILQPSGPNDDAHIGAWKNFVGIYAGRLGEKGVRSQLGRVWKASVIDAIFASHTG